MVLLRRSHAPQVEITPAHAQGLSFPALLAHARCSPQGGLVGNETLAEDIYLSVKQSSGLTQGMTVTGIAAVVVATVGMCGSVRGSPKCLYCYAVSSMTIIVCQSIFIAMLNFSVEDLDATVKTMIQDSDAAKDLVRQNGQQAFYVGLFAFAIEVLGFAGSLLAREALTRSMFDEEFRLGMYKDDLNQQLDGLNDELYTMTEGAPDGPAGWLQRGTSMMQLAGKTRC